ncbi:hypothetical protein INT47_006190 [Mucor saturninus]|uniref:GAR domain-containing protein n=1 Tax=Mucor saturninus TaxID=64648 RepID=A0A8H7RBK4_9FUNG|nr:hypothetical protein INT47_006190 [Mucor saturninus]
MTTTLGQISLPDKEIEHVFNSHDALSHSELVHVFGTIINKISQALESIHLATFTLEQQVLQDDSNGQDLEPLENCMLRMEPLIPVLSDLSDIILDKGDQPQLQEQQQQMKITRIQSEWSSLQHFLASVKKQLITSNNQKELTTAVERLLLQIDDISTMIFDFQERKHALPFPTTSTSSSDHTLEEAEPTKWLQSNKDDQLMLDIDAAFEPLLQSIELIYHRITDATPDSNLNRRFEKVKEKWELLQYERDELKFEHKEDRWLAVFRRVADQVDVMIDGLDRSVVQCYTLINQTREWQASQPTSTFDKFSKSFLRSFHHNPTNSLPPVDKEKFKSIEKSFEAKYKYYTPSIDRMLGMLGNGIAARASRDNSTAQRHDSMIQRWNHLKDVMDELRMRDLVETERIISSTTSTSSAASSSTSSPSSDSRHGWKGIRYRTPEPSYDRSVRSITPNSGLGRHSLGRSSPRKSNADHQSLLRGSLSDSSSVGSSTPPPPHHQQQQQQQTRNSVSRQTKTPRPTRNGSNTMKREDFYDEDERYYGVDLMKLQNTRPPSSNTMRSSSRSQSVERPLPNARSKTPNPPTSRTNRTQTIRSKSSMGDLMTNRVMSPTGMRRSVTPSLIPRPKTPKEELPSPMIPRPRSQVRNHNNTTNKAPPPVPPIPKYVISHESDYASYREPLRKKQSMPALRHKPSTMEISFHEDSVYHPDPKDPLDVEVSQIVNASPISIKCQKAQPGRYYFGNELSMSSMGGKKMYTCKLMTYGDRRGGQFKNNKVLIRVGGGWQDLEFFLLEHSSLMASDVVVRSFQSS